MEFSCQFLKGWLSRTIAHLKTETKLRTQDVRISNYNLPTHHSLKHLEINKKNWQNENQSTSKLKGTIARQVEYMMPMMCPLFLA